MRILAIDPGPIQSAYVELEGGRPVGHEKCDNDYLLGWVCSVAHQHDHVAIEMIASFGMAVGAEVFETVLWIGRFVQAIAERAHTPKLIYRLKVKQTLCHDSRAKDANIRQAIIDRFGGKEAAIGRKAAPGPLYGISGDEWSALAVALTYAEELAQ